ncbi:MAG: hypothetical protein KBT47_06210, partial [Armatimonadetes bacterium]|nr:hypothetical protein [Candidatus Hippobium faecium]
MKKLLFAILLIIIFGCFGNCSEVLYTDFSVPVPYGISFGDEFPNTETDMNIVKSEGVDNSPCFKINYKFHNTGRYWTANFDLENINAEGFSFMAKGEQGENLLVRWTDTTGEMFQADFNMQNNNWNRYEISFEDVSKYAHWSGDNNGISDGALKSVCIGVSKISADEGELYIDNISFAGNSKTLKNELSKMNLERLNFILDTGKTGNLFYYGEELTGEIVPNVPITDLNANLKLEFYDGFGNPIKTKIKNIYFSSKKKNTIALPDIKGFCEVKWTAKINNKNKSGSFSYAVIPDNSELCGKKDSYFGVITHALSPDLARLVKRSGISYI